MEEREVLKLARKTLALCNDHPWRSQAIAELDKLIEQKSNALAQPEQEPVAKAVVSKRKTDEHYIIDIDLTLTEAGKRLGSGEHCLYTTPPQRKPLTDEQIFNVARDHYNPHQRHEISFARAIEAAHGIKD